MKNRSEQTISFSAIMESEMKQKTVLKKETKRIETKSLHLTQVFYYKKNTIDTSSLYNNNASNINIIFDQIKS